MTASLRPEQRIRKRKDLEDLLKTGRSSRGPLLTLWVLKQNRGDKRRPMLAIMVSRKVSLRAVKRNLWKRRIRESFRLHQESLKPEAMILFRANGKGDAPAFAVIEKEMLGHFKKLEILN